VSTTTVVRVKPNGSVSGIEGADIFVAAVRAKTGKALGDDAIKREVTRGVERALRHQQHFLTGGIEKLLPLEPLTLKSEIAPSCYELLSSLEVEFQGETFSAALLFQKPAPGAPRSSRAAAHVAVLRSLCEEPFASDARLASMLDGSYSGLTVEDVASLRMDLGIPSAALRTRPSALLNEAVSRLAPTKWLRSLITSRLRLEMLAERRCPFPASWRYVHGDEVADSGDVLIDVGNDFVRLRRTTFLQAGAIWEQHQGLLNPIDDPVLENAFADLVTNAALGDGEYREGDLRVVVRSATAARKWSVPWSATGAFITLDDAATMLATCGAEDWDIILQTVAGKGSEGADCVDTMIAVLAHVAQSSASN